MSSIGGVAAKGAGMLTGTAASAVSGNVRANMEEPAALPPDDFFLSLDFESADTTSDKFLSSLDFQGPSEQATTDETLGQWFAKTGGILKGYGQTAIDIAKEIPAAAESFRQSAIDALSTPRGMPDLTAPSLTPEQMSGPQMKAQNVGFLESATDLAKETWSAFKENPDGIVREAVQAVGSAAHKAAGGAKIPVYNPDGSFTGQVRDETEEEADAQRRLRDEHIQDKYSGAALFGASIMNFASDPATYILGGGALKALGYVDKLAAAKQALAVEKATIGGGPVTAAVQKAAQLEAKAPYLQRAAIVATGIAAYEAPSVALDMYNRTGEIDSHEVVARTIATTGGGLLLDKAIQLGSALAHVHGDKAVPAQLDKLTEVMGENVQKGLNTEESLLRGMKAVGLDPDLPDDALALRVSAKMSDEYHRVKPAVTELPNKAGAPKSQFEQAREESKQFTSGLGKPSASERAFEQAREESKAYTSGLGKPSASERAFEQARVDSKKLNISALKGQRGSANVIPDYMAKGKYGIEVRKDGARVYLSEADTLDDAMTRAQKMANDTGAKVRVLDPLKKDGVTLVVPEQIGTKVDPFRKQRGYVRVPPGSTLVEPKVPGPVQYLLTPLYSAMKQISPRLANRIREHDFSVNSRAYHYTQDAQKWLAGFKTLNAGMKADISHALANKDWSAAQQSLTAAGRTDLVAELPKIRTLLDRMHADMTAHGIDVGYEADFYPRHVKDYRGLSTTLTGAERTALHKAVSAERARVGRPLTGDEEARVYSNVIRGGMKADIHPGVGSKGRQLDVVPKQLMSYYSNADEALELAISRVAKNVERARLFGATRVQDLNSAEDFGQAVDKLLLDAVKAGEITMGEQVEVLERMFRSRFVGGEQSAGKWTNLHRNATYGGLLTNPASAVQNMTDMAYAAFDAGIANTIRGAVRAASGKGITLDDIYINNLLQELQEKGLGSQVVDFGMKWSGFRKMDVFGKTTLINAQALDLVKKAQTVKGMDELRAVWEPVIGKDKLMNALAGLSTGKLNEDAKYMLVSKLADFHPVLPSEMAEGYLAHPGGRWLYTLHSYQLKQLDVFRQQILKGATTAPVEAAKKLTKMTAYLAMAGVPVAWLQDFILNRPLHSMEDIVAANMLKMVGLSTFAIDKYHLSPYDQRRTDIGGAVADVVAPPFAIFQNVYDDLKNAGDQFNTLQNVPVAGKLLYNWFGGGAEKSVESAYYQDQKKRRERKRAEDPERTEMRDELARAKKKRKIELWNEGFGSE